MGLQVFQGNSVRSANCIAAADRCFLELKLAVELLAGAAGRSRTIQNPRIQKPGLATAGLVEAIRPGNMGWRL